MNAIVRAPLFLAVFATLSSSLARARADAPPSGGDVLPIFSIAKSENKNQVQYVVHVDRYCVPLGPTPLSAYWRMLEHGPTQTEGLLPQEQPAYGLASQTPLASEATGGQVRAVLAAMPNRPLTVVTSRGNDGACHARAVADIGGTPANLFNVYVRLKWNGVDYLLLQGWSADGSRVVREKLMK